MTLALSCRSNGLRAAASILEHLTLRDRLHQTDRWCSLFCGVVGPCIRRTVSRSCLLFCLEDSSLAVEGSAHGRGGRTEPAQPQAASGPAPQLAGIPLVGRHRKASLGPRAAGNTGQATPTFEPTPPQAPGRAHRGLSRESRVTGPSSQPHPRSISAPAPPVAWVAAAWRPWVWPVCPGDDHPSPTCSLPSVGVEAGFR